MSRAAKARPASPRRPVTIPMQVAHSGHRSGLIAIAPTIRMLFLVSTPKAAITPAQAMYVRYWGTALAYCRDAAARSAHASGPPLQEGRSPGWAAASGRLPSVCSTVISSPDTPAATSSGRMVSTEFAATSAVTSSASPAAVGPDTTRWSTPAWPDSTATTLGVADSGAYTCNASTTAPSVQAG